jgi:hypothetical protein
MGNESEKFKELFVKMYGNLLSASGICEWLIDNQKDVVGEYMPGFQSYYDELQETIEKSKEIAHAWRLGDELPTIQIMLNAGIEKEDEENDK